MAAQTHCLCEGSCGRALSCVRLAPEQLCGTTSSRDHLLLGHPSDPAFAPDTLSTFYWLLRMACPVVSFVSSLYLWVSVRYPPASTGTRASRASSTRATRTLCASACAPMATSSSSPSE